MVELLALVLGHRNHQAPEIAVIQVQIVPVSQPHGCPRKLQAPDTLLLDGAIETDSTAGLLPTRHRRTRAALVVQQLVIDMKGTLTNGLNGDKGLADARFVLLLLVIRPQLHLQHLL